MNNIIIAIFLMNIIIYFGVNIDNFFLCSCGLLHCHETVAHFVALLSNTITANRDAEANADCSSLCVSDSSTVGAEVTRYRLVHPWVKSHSAIIHDVSYIHHV